MALKAKKFSQNKGFTFIELLTIIFIIGVLAAMILINLRSARAKARDAQRKSDAKAMQTALEMYADDNNKYASGKIRAVSYSPAQSGDPEWAVVEQTYSQYIYPLPKDPINNCSMHAVWCVGTKTNYTLNLNTNCYTVTVGLEKPTGNGEVYRGQSSPNCWLPAATAPGDLNYLFILETH